MSYRILAVLIGLGLFSAPVAAVDFGLKLQCELDKHKRLLPKHIYVEVDETFLRARVSDENIRESGKERVFTDEVWVTNKKIRISYKVLVTGTAFARPITYRFSWFRASGKFSLHFQDDSGRRLITRGRGKCVIKTTPSGNGVRTREATREKSETPSGNGVTILEATPDKIVFLVQEGADFKAMKAKGGEHCKKFGKDGGEFRLQLNATSNSGSATIQCD